MKLKAKFGKSHYKNTNAWLDAIYRNNKQLIDNTLVTTEGTSAKTVFKRLVKENINEGNSPIKAVNKLAKSTVFTSTRDRLVDNAYQGIVGDKEAYKAFRNLTKENGRFTKIDRDKFNYDKDTNSYTYDNVRISFRNSPYGVIIEEM